MKLEEEIERSLASPCDVCDGSGRRHHTIFRLRAERQEMWILCHICMGSGLRGGRGHFLSSDELATIEAGKVWYGKIC